MRFLGWAHGLIRFLPAKPPQWARGSLKGVRLRGGIAVRELTWDGPKAEPVRWLLAHGADRNARNKSGKTAAEIGRAHAGIVRMLAK